MQAPPVPSRGHERPVEQEPRDEKEHGYALARHDCRGHEEMLVTGEAERLRDRVPGEHRQRGEGAQAIEQGKAWIARRRRQVRRLSGPEQAPESIQSMSS
jgi:hypothetical protein